jgi:hypothetical protein
MEDYLILGACNPGLAHRALDMNRQIGQLMPCNVVVRTGPANDQDDDQGGAVIVEAMDPQLMVQVTGRRPCRTSPTKPPPSYAPPSTPSESNLWGPPTRQLPTPAGLEADVKPNPRAGRKLTWLADRDEDVTEK